MTDRPHQGWAGSDRVQTRGGQVWGRVRRREGSMKLFLMGGGGGGGWDGGRELNGSSIGDAGRTEKERHWVFLHASAIPPLTKRWRLQYNSGKNVLCSDYMTCLLKCRDTFNENTGHTQLYKHQKCLIVLFLMYFWINKCSIDEKKRL